MYSSPRQGQQQPSGGLVFKAPFTNGPASKQPYNLPARALYLHIVGQQALTEYAHGTTVKESENGEVFVVDHVTREAKPIDTVLSQPVAQSDNQRHVITKQQSQIDGLVAEKETAHARFEQEKTRLRSRIQALEGELKLAEQLREQIESQHRPQQAPAPPVLLPTQTEPTSERHLLSLVAQILRQPSTDAVRTLSNKLLDELRLEAPRVAEVYQNWRSGHVFPKDRKAAVLSAPHDPPPSESHEGDATRCESMGVVEDTSCAEVSGPAVAVLVSAGRSEPLPTLMENSPQRVQQPSPVPGAQDVESSEAVVDAAAARSGRSESPSRAEASKRPRSPSPPHDPMEVRLPRCQSDDDVVFCRRCQVYLEAADAVLAEHDATEEHKETSSGLKRPKPPRIEIGAPRPLPPFMSHRSVYTKAQVGELLSSRLFFEHYDLVRPACLSCRQLVAFKDIAEHVETQEHQGNEAKRKKGKR